MNLNECIVKTLRISHFHISIHDLMVLHKYSQMPEKEKETAGLYVERVRNAYRLYVLHEFRKWGEDANWIAKNLSNTRAYNVPETFVKFLKIAGENGCHYLEFGKGVDYPLTQDFHVFISEDRSLYV